MSDRTNQHFVPQFYFKNFSQGKQSIHMLLKAEDRIISHAKIRRQCARRNFYGSKEIESALSELEGRHARSLRSLINAAWDADSVGVTPQEMAWIWEAVVFQRSRTVFHVEKTNPAMESLFLEQLIPYLRHASDIDNRHEILHALESGLISIKRDPTYAVLQSIEAALGSVLLISDLGIYVLRNRTDFPFVFSDAPVVLCNSYLRKVRTRGVLGLQSPGLQVFLPLDSRTMLMLVDENVYFGKYKNQFLFDIIGRSDVSQLNALQFHHSQNAIYFGNSGDADYVMDMWQAHKSTIQPTTKIFRKMRRALVNDRLEEGPFVHVFEPQLNFHLRLSFIYCSPIEEKEYRFSRRSPELVAQNQFSKHNNTSQGSPKS